MSEAAWAAGLFDGEGSTMCYIRPIRRSSSFLNMRVEMTDKESVYRFHRAVGGVGKVYLRKTLFGKRRASWVWATAKFWDTQMVLSLLWPWLGEEKRQQAAKATTSLVRVRVVH